MFRYYCSGFDISDAFGHGLGEFFKSELKAVKSIVYITGNPEKIEKARTKYIPLFTEHFRKVGIQFEQVNLITPDLSQEEAKKMVREANYIMLMGGDPFKQKKLCYQLDILRELKDFKGVMVGFSAGAMLMSKLRRGTTC